MSFMVFIEKKYICLKRKTDFRRKKGKLILEYTTTCHLQKKKTGSLEQHVQWKGSIMDV